MAGFVANETLCFATTASTIPEPGASRKNCISQLALAPRRVINEHAFWKSNCRKCKLWHETIMATFTTIRIMCLLVMVYIIIYHYISSYISLYISYIIIYLLRIIIWYIKWNSHWKSFVSMHKTLFTNRYQLSVLITFDHASAFS